MRKHNFFIEGQRISEPRPINNRNNFLEFDMLIKQPFQTKLFADLKIRVQVDKTVWEAFESTGRSTEWLTISGYLHTYVSHPVYDGVERENYYYKMKAIYITAFDNVLYENLGGHCYFEGDVKVKKIEDLNSNVPILAKKLLLTNDLVLLEAQALRSKAKSLASDNIEVDDLVRVNAKLMPSTNKKRKPPYFTLKSIKKI